VAINYPGNPRFSQHQEINQRRRMLTEHAVVITDEGPLEVRSREEVKEIILHHFGISKHAFYVY
jgi:hypothetical protein